MPGEGHEAEGITVRERKGSGGALYVVADD